MAEKDRNTPIKKVELNYMSAVTHTPPVQKIPVSSSKIEELDMAIRKKIEQNKKQFNMTSEDF